MSSFNDREVSVDAKSEASKVGISERHSIFDVESENDAEQVEQGCSKQKGKKLENDVLRNGSR